MPPARFTYFRGATPDACELRRRARPLSRRLTRAEPRGGAGSADGEEKGRQERDEESRQYSGCVVPERVLLQPSSQEYGLHRQQYDALVEDLEAQGALVRVLPT